MPKIHLCRQGSDAWLTLRAGIPTASCFDRIVTPKGKVSAQSRRYIAELIAERVTGRHDGGDASQWMLRGSDLEREAVDWYSLERGLDVTEVGFITTDDGRWGCSPDRLIGEVGLLELKCPSAETHVLYMLEGSGDHYWPQVQGQLLVSGRKWVDFVSYCPGFRPLIERHYPDAKFQDSLANALEEFSQTLEASEGLVRGEEAVR